MSSLALAWSPVPTGDRGDGVGHIEGVGGGSGVEADVVAVDAKAPQAGVGDVELVGAGGGVVGGGDDIDFGRLYGGD